MIVEIEKPRPSVMDTLDYNEGKVLRGVAELVGYANLRSTTREDIYALFGRCERGARYPTLERSFHASVNPSETDTCTEEEVLSFIAGLMEHLGYGAQPFLVYRHFDIERVHYHVVSTRIGRDGRKINNHYEKRRAADYMRRVARRYSFSLAEKGGRVPLPGDISSDPPERAVSRFDARKEVTAQMRALFSRALSYDFSSFAQLAFILEDLGLRAVLDSSGPHPAVTLQGLDRKGEPVTAVFTEETLGLPLYGQCLSVLRVRQQGRRQRSRERGRVRSLTGFAFQISRSEGHFVNILRKKGIAVHLSRTRESGDIFGVSFVDHVTRTVFKASELRGGLTVRALQEAVSSGRWRAEERGRRRSSYVSRTRETLRDSVRLRDLHAGALARILRPAGQPQGSSWSGKSGPSEEELYQEWDEGKAGSVFADFNDHRFEKKLK